MEIHLCSSKLRSKKGQTSSKLSDVQHRNIKQELHEQ